MAESKAMMIYSIILFYTCIIVVMGLIPADLKIANSASKDPGINYTSYSSTASDKATDYYKYPTIKLFGFIEISTKTVEGWGFVGNVIGNLSILGWLSAVIFLPLIIISIYLLAATFIPTIPG